MTDHLDPATRSRNMAAIRSKDTKPEYRVRSALHRLGFRFRLHNKKLPGSPDLVLPKYHAVIFVNGCFWHQHQGCKAAHLPATRRDFWAKKFAGNVMRDQKILHQLKILGWRTAIIWECGLNNNIRTATIAFLCAWLRSPAEYFEQPIYDEFSEI